MGGRRLFEVHHQRSSSRACPCHTAVRIHGCPFPCHLPTPFLPRTLFPIDHDASTDEAPLLGCACETIAMRVALHEQQRMRGTTVTTAVSQKTRRLQRALQFRLCRPPVKFTTLLRAEGCSIDALRLTAPKKLNCTLMDGRSWHDLSVAIPRCWPFRSLSRKILLIKYGIGFRSSCKWHNRSVVSQPCWFYVDSLFTNHSYKMHCLIKTHFHRTPWYADML